MTIIESLLESIDTVDIEDGIVLMSLKNFKEIEHNLIGGKVNDFSIYPHNEITDNSFYIMEADVLKDFEI
jgi:hypothetical protein